MPCFFNIKRLSKLYTLLSICLLLHACDSSNSSDSAKPPPPSDPPQKEIDIKKGEFKAKDRIYPTLQINNLDWLGTNLDLPISESWCYNSQSTCEEQGRLYRWPGAKEACEKLGEGWRLPTEEEWQQLANTFGGYMDWLSEETFGDPVAANEALAVGGKSGFDALLSGWRGSNGGFDSAEKMGFYWTASEANEDEAWFYIILPSGSKLTRRSTNKRMGMACRCVRNIN